MRKSIKDALEDAKKRLKERLPDIEKKLKEAERKSADEPDHLRSGVGLDELELKRAIKEQENEAPS